MSKNLILLQNGFPGSTTSGEEVTSLNIKNFFKYEKSYSGTQYARLYYNTHIYSNTPYFTTREKLGKAIEGEYYEKETGNLAPNNLAYHYSIHPLLFSMRMKKGFCASNILITSRLEDNENLKLKFLKVGSSVDDFKALYSWKYWMDYPYQTVYPYRFCEESLNIPSLDNKNYCFFAFLYSTSAYNLETGTVLLNNEPLLNISWTETEFIEA